MSSSGQAPNVSMDDLLSSIKSMIEGESSGGGNPPEQGMVAEPPVAGALPGNAVDDGIMDLTQIAQAQPQTQPQEGQIQAQALGQPMAQGGQPMDLGQPVVQPPVGEAPVFQNPEAAMQLPAVQPPIVQPPVAGGEGMVGQTAQDAASQINDILGGMNADLGVEALAPAPLAAPMAAPDAGGLPLDEAPIDPRATVAPYPGDLMGDPMAGDKPLNEQPAAGQNLAAYQPMVDEVLGGREALGREAVGRAELSSPPAEMPDGAALQQHIVQEPVLDPQAAFDSQVAVDPMVNSAMGNPAADMHPDGALSRGLGGETPMGNPALQGQMGQPPQGQQPVGQVPQGQQPVGQMTQGQFGQGQMQGQQPQGQVPQGQMQVGQPPVGQMGMAGQPPGFDPRQESEFAMGQALSQADASLNATPLGQNLQRLQQPQGLHQQMAGGAPLQGMHPGGQQQQHQLPVVATGGGLPVPMGRAQLPVAQPMMGLADPSVDQLPVEMRNNLEEIVKQLLKPLLREWLERNLPELLKTAVDDQGKIDPNKL